MGWSDFTTTGLTRAELAKKLWIDGLSATAIAMRLGGVTRNAVIGKVHRMGAASSAPRYKRSSQNGPRKRRAPRPPRAKRYTSEAAIAERAAMDEIAAERHAVQLGPDLIVPVDERKTIHTLTEMSCRWPFGDPKEPDFHFCNGTRKVGAPYCAFHCARAFQPEQPRHRFSVSTPVALLRAGGGADSDRSRELKEFDAMERA